MPRRRKTADQPTHTPDEDDSGDSVAIARLKQSATSAMQVHPNGRPYGITGEQTALLIEKVLEGCFFTVACDAVGVNYETFCDWLVKGGDPKSNDKGKPTEPLEPYKSFALAMRQAEAMAIADATVAIKRAFRYDWKAAAHFLAKKQPQDWGDKSSLQVATSGNVSIYLPNNNRDVVEEP